MEITQISVKGVLYDIVDTKTTINGKTGEIAASDIAAVLEGAGYDTRIPEWAKQPNKPTYTAAEVGLGNVGNYKAVSTSQLLGLSESELRYARENIGAGTSNFSGSYSDLTDKPSIPTDLSQFSNNNSHYATEDWVNNKLNDILGVNASGIDALKTALSDNDAATGILKTIADKVDKEQGKGLSTNDYTDADKSKLAGIASGAQAHVAPTAQEVKDALGVGNGTTKYLREDGTWQVIPDNSTTYDVATTSVDGLMSATDKQKLDSIDTSTLLTQSDVPNWVIDGSKPSYIYDEIGYEVTTVSTSGAVSLVGTHPLYEVILTGNVSSVTLSTNPSVGHSCHVIFANQTASDLTISMTHDSTNRICAGGTDPDPLEVPAGGYVEVDFLNTNGRVYVNCVQ